jgi:hypothetical protein
MLAVYDGFLTLRNPSAHIFHTIFESDALVRKPNDECCVYLSSDDMSTFKLFPEWAVEEHLEDGPDMPTSPKIWELKTAKAVKMLGFAEY